MSEPVKLALVGAGKMASAIVRGILSEGILLPPQIGCICGPDNSGPELSKATGICHMNSAKELFSPGQIVLLACKPQQLEDLPAELASLTEGSLVLSILAGTRLEQLTKKFPYARNVVRSMPNTPGQVRAGVTAFSPAKPLEQDDLLQIEGILSALGTFMELPEDQLDAVTAVSGSGPAYVFEFTIALRKAAEAAGLSPQVAETLARETVCGAALLMSKSWQKPEDLRNAVTSPGGTTQAALESIAASDLHGLMQKAVETAKKRSIELSGS